MRVFVSLICLVLGGLLLVPTVLTLWEIASLGAPDWQAGLNPQIRVILVVQTLLGAGCIAGGGYCLVRSYLDRRNAQTP